jgi:hydrogenase nickel incorporation protein HypB
MCETCGCGAAETTLTDLQTGQRTAIGEGAHAHRHADGTWHAHSHAHDLGHEDHSHDHQGSHSHQHGRLPGRDGDPHHHHDHAPEPSTTVVELNARILEKNDKAAERNRAWLDGREVLAINLMSGPGAGKTTLLEKTIALLKDREALFVLEGDQATDHDGARVKAAGACAVQINTGKGCHLDAEMVAGGLRALRPSAGALLFIENVGNLVCPALFDLGEHRRVAILSVTEGDDKPLKYPHMFAAADLMLLNKIDLLAHVDFDVERATALAQQVNPHLQILAVSARTGEGLDAWTRWLGAARVEAGERAFV